MRSYMQNGAVKNVIIIIIIIIIITTIIIISSSNHHHHQANMQLGHLLTRSGLTLLEVFLMVSPGFFCLLVCNILVF